MTNAKHTTFWRQSQCALGYSHADYENWDGTAGSVAACPKPNTGMRREHRDRKSGPHALVNE